MLQKVDLLGIPIHDVTYAEALDLAREFIRSGRPHQVTTVNPEFVMTAQRDPEFRRVLCEAALSLPDGIGLLLGARLLGFRLREHVRGTDYVELLADLAVREGYRLFFLGAAEGVAAEAAANLQRRHPGLQVAGTYSGSPRPAEEEAIVSLIRAAGPVHILLVAYGAPAQDKWIARNLPRLGVPLAVGVGGVFDYLSGRVPRAPLWLRQLELEWLYRLLRQPRRWRRQLALPHFALAVLGRWLRQRLFRGGDGGGRAVLREEDH